MRKLIIALSLFGSVSTAMADSSYQVYCTNPEGMLGFEVKGTVNVTDDNQASGLLRIIRADKPGSRNVFMVGKFLATEFGYYIDLPSFKDVDPQLQGLVVGLNPGSKNAVRLKGDGPQGRPAICEVQ